MKQAGATLGPTSTALSKEVDTVSKLTQNIVVKNPTNGKKKNFQLLKFIKNTLTEASGEEKKILLPTQVIKP